jgi:prepilin-type N-terminal cleavage/methylation domain-containing protein
MKTIQRNVASFTKQSGTTPSGTKRFGRNASGFTLIELMIAITVFLVIGAAAMSLFRQHASLFNDQQYQNGLNVSLRNALSQMEGDIVNAGTGWYNATNNVSSWPIGVTIANMTAGGAGCHPPGTSTYTSLCFDTLNVIIPDPATPPGQVWVTPGTQPPCTATVSTSTGAMSILPIAPSTQSQLLTGFTAGSQVVFVHVTASGTQMTTAKLAGSSAGTGGSVNLTYGATTTINTVAGANNPGPLGNDAFSLTTNPDATIDPSPITDSFCNGTDWVVKVAPITYSVDVTDPTNPTLSRKENNVNVPLASQVIGFKVGATTVALDTTTGISTGSSAAYCYNNSSNVAPCYNNQYGKIRSVRISLIGRTPPKMFQNSTYSPTLYTNSFDGQPYKIQSLSIIVNPRNLSMND